MSRRTGVRNPAPGRFLRRDGNIRVRRERRHRTAAWALRRVAVIAGTIGLLGVGAAWASRWIMTTPALAVSSIRVEGAENADPRTVRSLASGALGRNLIRLDLDQVAATVRTHPWVKSVVVRRQLPDTIVVRVVERTPCALVLLRGEPFLVDTTGARIDRFGPRYASWSFPVLRGLDGLEPADRARRCRAAAVQLHALKKAAPDLHERLAEVDLSNPDRTELTVAGLSSRLRVAPDDWTRNLDAYRDLQASLDSRHEAIRYVDLRWDGRVTVMPDGIER